MKFLVVGLGSMGRRRIRLLKKISKENEIIGVDFNEKRCKQTETEFDIKTYTNLDNALDKFHPNSVIVSTSPISHASIIRKCLEVGCNVFSEINLISDGYKENIALSEKNDKVLFLSSTFIYRKEIQYIEKKLNRFTDNVNYNYHVGQYLPDWHPWEKINDFFVKDKRTNGCRELFAIELPWIIKVFGKIRKVNVNKSIMSSLGIDYNDNYQVLIEHENGNKGCLSIDVVSRKPVRRLEIYNEQLYLTWDGKPTTLVEYDFVNNCDKVIDLYDAIDSDSDYAEFIIENAYENELRNFIEVVDKNATPLYSFREDIDVIKVIDCIEN